MTDSYQQVKLELLHESPTNPRRDFNEERLAELAASIRANGIVQPLIVRDVREQGKSLPRYEVVAGARRFRAAKLAGVGSVPVIRKELSDRQVLEVQLIENNQREDVSAAEEATGFGRLVAAGVLVDEIAERIGRHRRYVRRRLALLELDEWTLERVHAGDINLTSAAELAALPDTQRGDIENELKQLPDSTGVTHLQHSLYSLLSRCKTRLSFARFSLDDEALVDGVGSCSSCPFRSSNQADLFGASEDLCLKPSCFTRKKDAHLANELVRLKEGGARVLDEMPPWESIARTAYIECDDGSFESVDPECAGAEPVYYVGHGSLWKEYLADEVRAVAANSEDPVVRKAFAASDSTQTGAASTSVSSEVRRQQSDLLFPAKGRAPKRPKRFYRHALHVAIAGARSGDVKEFCKRRGWDPKKVHERVAKVADSAAREALIELSLAGALYSNYRAEEMDGHLSQLLELIGGPSVIG